jgi:hypothetical protein
VAILPAIKRTLPEFQNPSLNLVRARLWLLPVLLLVFGPSAWAGVQSEPATRTEFDPAASDAPSASLDDVLPTVDFRLEASLSGFLFVDDGMSDAYTSIPIVQTGLTMDLGPQLQFLLGAGYGSTTSDLKIDDTFDGTQELKLRVVPLQMGFRTNMTALRSFRVNFGAYFQAVWLEETAPYFQTYPYLETGSSTDTCWGHQILMSLGPEWRLDDEKWVIGFEALTGIGGGNLNAMYEREVSLDGFGGRLYCSLKLGSIQEEKRIGEVRR